MKAKSFFAFALIFGCSASLVAQNRGYSESEIDTTSILQLNEVVVSATKASFNAPFAISEISRKKLEDFSKDVREIPFLLSSTPGVVAWGENGLGTGTSYMRIRGAGDSRINVTLDGVPLNSPEDQCVFWANLNSYAAFLGGVQIQRGVGSSTNGDGAFGGAVSMTTKEPSLIPTAYFSGSYGSYNSTKANLSLSTGLIGKHLVIDAGVSYSRTDGYIHGTKGDGGNWIIGLHYLASNDFVLRYRNIGNMERTGQAWNGVVTGNDDLSILDGTYGMSTGIKTYADMCRVGLSRYNNLYEYLVTDDSGNFVQDATGNYKTQAYSYGNGYWDRTTDNFYQDHNILSAVWRINDYWKLNASLHYTYGYGYYDEFRPNNKLSKFGITSFIGTDGSTIKRTDFVREKGLTQHKYGIVANTTFDKDEFHLNIGISAQNFNANHFGYITYIADQQVENAIKNNGAASWYNVGDSKYQYYNSVAIKRDLSAFVKFTYDITPYLNAFADLQYRYVNYKTWGINDKFLEDSDGGYSNQVLNVNQHYHFVNPKIGITLHKNGHKAFASFAMSNREPERNNFTDNGAYPAPKPERLLDYEVGYNYSGNNFEAGATLYYMSYKDQFVQTGALSDIGEALTTNIASSYRAGVEIVAAYSPVRWFTIDGNVALSTNRIKDFTEVVEDWDNGSREIHYDNSTLAFSPSIIAGANVTFRPFKGAKAIWHTNYVSRQYLDNTQCQERSIPAYTFSDITLNYSWNIGKNWIKSIDFGVKFGNIFNSKFAQSGWVYSAIYESGGHTNDNRYTQIGYIPSAGFTCIGSIALHF